jgi:hypothetical protein
MSLMSQVLQLSQGNASDFFRVDPDLSMADDDPNLDSWNVRKFPKELKRECQAQVKKSGKREPRWLAEILCAALSLPREVYLDPIYGTGDTLDSANRGAKEKVRLGSRKTAKSGTAKTERGQN